MSLLTSNIGRSAQDNQVKKQINWTYKQHPYQQSGDAIQLAQKAYQRRDLRFIQRDNNKSKSVINKSKAMYQYANQITFDRNKSGEQTIYQKWPLQQDKYIQFDCQSQNSEDNQVQIDFPCCDDIMAIIDTEKQQGKMYLVLKAKLPRDQDFTIAVQRIKGGGLDRQVVEALGKKDSYYLFKISMTSQIKIFKILLLMNGNRVSESRNYNFNLERIEYDAGLSYDFIEDRRLTMSNFEGLLAASSFGVVDQIDFFEKSMNKFQESNKAYLEDQIQFDPIFDKFIVGQRNPQRFLLQFQAILKSPQNQDEKINFYRKPIIQKIANYFMKYMVNIYQLKIDQQKKITLNKAQRLIECFLQILSIEMITNGSFKLLNEINKDEVGKRVASFIQFLIQHRKYDIVAQYVHLQIVNEFNILHKWKGLDSILDSIRQSVEAFDETYIDLGIMFIYYYMKYTQMSDVQLIRSLDKAYSNTKYLWIDQLEDRFGQIKQPRKKQAILIQFEIEIAKSIKLPQRNYDLFKTLHKLVQSNKPHDYLKQLFRNQALNRVIQQFIDNMVRQIPQQRNSQIFEKGINILVDLSCDQPNKYFNIFPNKLVTLNNKILRYSSERQSIYQLQKKCILDQKLILNPLMKSGSNQKLSTIKSISTDIANVLKIRLSFKAINEVMNECFEPNIISNLVVQQIYTNNLLRQVYKVFINEDNATDIERQRGQFINWHNNFNYKPFINTFLVQSVTKVLCAGSKDKRRKNAVITNLKNLIQTKGQCNAQQKQNLKGIVQLDNLQLDEKSFIDVLTKTRDRLYLLKKIKQQGDEQKFTLQSLISQFRRKALHDQLSGRIYYEIYGANKLQKNWIESIFKPQGLMNIIEQKVHNMNECFQKLTKYKNFIQCLNKRYKLSDYQTIIKNLKQSEQNTRQKHLSHIQQILSYLNKVDQKILRCYSFRSFFIGQNVQNISLNKAIQNCNYLQKRIIQNRDRVMRQYVQNEMTYESISFFEQQLQRQKQLFDLFMMNVNQNEQNVADANMIKQLLKIFSLLKKIPNITNYINGLRYYLQLDQSRKYKQLSLSLKSFSQYLNQISKQVPSTNISKLYHEYQKANKLIGGFRFSKSSSQCLNLEYIRSIQLLQFLYNMSMVSQQNINKILQIKSELNNMKQKCDEDEQQYMVDFEDLQKADIIIKYIQNIYVIQKNNFKSLISSTIKYIINYPRLKLSYLVFKKINQLYYQYKHVNQGDKKMVQKINSILQKCIVDIKFNHNIINISLIQLQPIYNNQSIKINKINQNNINKQNMNKIKQNLTFKQILITQQDIRKYKNQTILYIIQNNQKHKSNQQKQKTQNYQSFLNLLKCIDQIQLIWKQLQQWGFIIFRKQQVGDCKLSILAPKPQQSQSEENIKIQVNQNNHQQLIKYVQNRKKICQMWKKQIKALQLISPKAALLQGQSVKNFYQVLTGFSTQKIANFLNVCEVQILKEYIREKKGKLIYQKSQQLAINAIKDFFNYYVTKQKQIQPSVNDYSQSYLKTILLNQKQHDLIQGIVQLDYVRIQNLDLTKILICVDGTTSLDVKSFIQTALRDEKNEYVIMRPQKLSNKDQQYIIKQIKQHKQNNDNKLTLKLCLVSNSTIQSLYQYLINNINKNTSYQVSKQQRQKAYLDFIGQVTQNVLIVKSKCPGFGKTSYIMQKSGDRACYFLPISGAPDSISIYERFEKITKQIYLRKDNQKKDSSLVIQIHNIDPNNYQIVNTFLQQVITGRCVRYNGMFPKLLKQTKIFIQIQNIQSVNNYDPLITFTFLKQIISKKGQSLIYNRQTRPAINFDKFDRKKMEYILDHLEFLDKPLFDNDLKDKNIKRFNEYQAKGINEDRGRQLIKKYFFDKFPGGSTFYQLQYFSKLFFQACRAFSSSYGLSFDNLTTNYSDYYRKLLGLNTIRSQFFKVLLTNCIDFIGRQVDYEQFNYQNRSNTQQQLSSIPFLIIPNTDGQSFSFIYKDAQTVPSAIRNFYISQNTQLIVKITLKTKQQELIALFQSHSMKKLQATNAKKFDEKIKQTLQNISGNKKYSIEKDPNYVVNIDNFFKMCLITLRERQNIPIIIMGEAGTGKTALLKHVSQQLYQHQFMTLNINAGTTVNNVSAFLRQVKERHKYLKSQKQRIQLQNKERQIQKKPLLQVPKKKIWVFFDQFNTLKGVGYIKQIIIDRRFQGKQLQFLKDVVIMAACNPFRKLKVQNNVQAELSIIQQEQPQNVQQTLAFHVLPPPHSMIECMWNYGALSPYQYEKYITKMISNVQYKTKQATILLLKIHDQLSKKFDSSFVSLRDIERFRTIFQFFNKRLPLNPHPNTQVYPGYNNRQQRALILSFVFCYTLRIESQQIKDQIYKYIEEGLQLNKGHTLKVKQVQETDFFNRLKLDYASIAANSAIKQNTYAFFVAVYNRLPMIIVGPPGCSKSLAIRILTENMKGMNSQDKQLREFQQMRAINFQGSQLCTSSQVQKLFKKAIESNKNNANGQQSSLVVIVFDQIGLADKSKDNPLKVIHPYLQVSKDLNLNDKGVQLKQRNYSFLGISNTNLDISKMSRMLVLRRPQPSTKQLKDTAVGIGRSFEYGKNQKIAIMIENISEAYFRFVQQWQKQRRFRNFYSLRDFYSLIKYFLGACQLKQVNINDDKQLANLFEESVFKNLHGMNGSIQLFMKSYRAQTQQIAGQQKIQNKFDIIQNILRSLQKQNLRFPLVIVEDEESLSYLINMLMNKFKKKTTYFEKSPFINDKQNNSHVLHTTASIIKTIGKGDKLILNNIEPTIQTSLYDMLNKFYIVRGDQNYCRISQVESGLTKKTLVNKQFNCICFLLEDNLHNVEAPFLSRFEKYIFSLKKITEIPQITKITKQVQIFKKTVMEICNSKNLSHYRQSNFFQNCERDILRTLILRTFNQVNNEAPKVKMVQSMIQQQQTPQDNEQIIFDEIIYDMVMNSTQDFIMIYEYILSKQPQMKRYSNAIVRASQKKKAFKIDDTNNIILFTTDKNIVFNGCNQPARINSVKFEFIKKQESFDKKVSQFLNSKQEIYLFVELKQFELGYIQYLISQIQKVKQQQIVSKNNKFQNKKIFLLYQLDRKQDNVNKNNRNQFSNNKNNKKRGISFLCEYPQIFYQGKLQLGMIKYEKKEFFENVLDLSHIIGYCQNFFQLEIKSKDQQKKPQLLKVFKTLYNQLKIDKKSLLHRHLEEFIEKTQGTNITINQTLVLEVLENPQFLKNCKNFKQALTKQLSNKNFYAVVAFFLKYLFQNQAFLTYSTKTIHDYNARELFNLLPSRIRMIQNTKIQKVYLSNLKFMTSKKIDFVGSEYKKLKAIKRLPSVERKFTAQIQRGRLIHFSKAENQMILSNQIGSLKQLATKILSKVTNIEKQSKLFKQQLYKKSNFVIKKDINAQNSLQNLYITMSKDQSLKQLFIYELLIDFVQRKGINVKFIQMYMKILKLFISFDGKNNKKTLELEFMIFALLAFEQVLTFIFKLFSVFFDAQIFLTPSEDFFQNFRIRQIKDISQESCLRFITNLIKNFLQPLFTNNKNIPALKGAKYFYEIFTNSMLQIENLQKILKRKQSFSTNLVSLRDIARFCSQFNEQHKFQLLQKYLISMNERKNQNNTYSVTFSFIQSLNSKQLSSAEIQIIIKFQANKIFLQWFKDKPDDVNCLRFFIQKCESDQNFCHSSMHVINYLLNQKQYDYSNIQEVEQIMKDPGNQLSEIAKHSKQKEFQNNLCILMVNIFIQKLQKVNKGKSHQEIIGQHKNKFIHYYKKLSLNNLKVEIFQIFLFAYVKFVLISYAELFLKDKIDNQISQILNTKNNLSINLRLFVLKILRKYYTPKQIKEKFINIKRMHWSPEVQADFKENQARSLIVPKDFCSIQLAAILNEIQLSDGSAFVQFQKLLQFAKGFENRYSILNFFMRFYYSLSYNQKVYKAKTIQHFATIKVKYEEKMGKIQTQLIERYLKNQVSPHFCTKSSDTVNEQDFVTLNFINMFLASKNSVSPLHSLFYKQGQLQSDISTLTNQQFVISGPQNPFINIAESVIELTRNNNIGVYICCSDCDYIYSHEDCGWPNQQVDCPMCGQKIGRKDKGHSLSRDDKGARRLISKVLVDKSVYYVWSMTQLTEYWQVQRKYIEAEINRMKLQKVTTIKSKKETCKLTGLNIVNSGRISNFSFKMLTFFFDAISYLLVSLKVINPAEIQKLFGIGSQEQALNKFNQSIKQSIRQMKQSLNLGNKLYGWVFGIQRNYILQLNNFSQKFKEYQASLVGQMEKLKVKLNIQIQQKKIKQQYINLYVDFTRLIDERYFIKQVCSVQDYTASNRFTRDFSQKMFEDLVKLYTGDKKFDFSTKYQSTQGKMQFPFDCVLTEDDIDKEKYNYYRIFKLPDQQIGYQDISVKYEAIIKEKYPYLDYILKNSDQFNQMKNFYSVVSFVNELHKQVNNRYERTKGEQSLGSFIQQLKQQFGNSLSKTLKNPQLMIQSWKKLSKFLGDLQNQCKKIGRMNDQYNMNTQLKAFLLDQSTKQNVYGLMIASIFHNFAKMHNQSMAVLNSRKNQIKSYSSLNLFNELLKLHPQQIQSQQIFIFDDQQLKQNLQSCSVASIIYGQNFIFHNFDAYQEHFINKLGGKCQIISNLKQYFNVCYNGEAFSAQTQGSAVLAEIRKVLDKNLSQNSLRKVKDFINKSKNPPELFQKAIIQVRGDLQKIMLQLHTLKGNYSKDQSCGRIINETSISVKTAEIKNDQLSEIPVCQIYDLYEFLQDELKYFVLKRLPQKYKTKMTEDMSLCVQNFFKQLPRQATQDKPTLEQLQSAIIKFTSRTLQNGIFDETKMLVQFVCSRQDFWLKDYSQEKKSVFMYDPMMCLIKIGNVMNVLQIIQKVKKDKM